MSTLTVRHWQKPDDAALKNILQVQIFEDPAWPPAYAHTLNLGDWLGNPADLGRWVAVSAGCVVGHIGLGTINGSVAEAFAKCTGHHPDQFAELCRTVVDARKRGSGVASALTRAALKSSLAMRRIPVATVLTGRGTWLEMMLNTGWQRIGDIETIAPNERLVLLLAPRKFVDGVNPDGG